jgi:hypothetical protein
MSLRHALLPSLPPGLVLAVAVGGQWKEQLAALALIGAGATIVWAVVLGVALLVQVARKAAWAPVFVGIVVSCFAVIAAVALVFDAPRWVQQRAAPAIDAIERIHREAGAYPPEGSLDGDFPRALRVTLEQSGHCVYKPKGSSYRLVCLGTPLARCSYDGATGRWAGGE